MKYCIQYYHEETDSFIDNCVDVMRLTTRTETAENAQFRRDNHLKHFSRDEETTIHGTKRTT